MKETKEPIKVNISTFLLIIAMIIIGVMAYFMYSQKLKSDKEIADLQAEVQRSQSPINEMQTKLDSISNIANTTVEETNKTTNITNTKETKNIITYDKVVGKYECELNGNLNDGMGYKFELTLAPNGQFTYNCWGPTQWGSIGNYIIDGNTIIMNELFSTHSDISTGVMKESKLELKINDDFSITDKSNFVSRVTASEVTSITLNKSNSTDNKVDINSYLRGIIQENALFLEQ